MKAALETTPGPHTNGAATAKEKPPRIAWLYADALKEAKLLEYFLKQMVEDASGRHGNLRAALTHNLRLNVLIKSLLEQEETA